jgi:hypothetical protein
MTKKDIKTLINAIDNLALFVTKWSNLRKCYEEAIRILKREQGKRRKRK